MLPSTYCDPNMFGSMQARTELQRREKYIKLLDAHIGAVHPAVALANLIKQCLLNAPQQRPGTKEVLIGLQEMRPKLEGVYGEPIKLDLAKVRLAKEMKEQDRKIDMLQVSK